MTLEQHLDKIYDKISDLTVKVAESNVHLQNHAVKINEQEKKIIVLEAYRNKTIGISLVGGSILGTIGGAIVKFLF